MGSPGVRAALGAAVLALREMVEDVPHRPAREITRVPSDATARSLRRELAARRGTQTREDGLALTLDVGRLAPVGRAEPRQLQELAAAPGRDDPGGAAAAGPPPRARR